jgi:hypothetical protein
LELVVGLSPDFSACHSPFLVTYSIRTLWMEGLLGPHHSLDHTWSCRSSCQLSSSFSPSYYLIQQSENI